MTRIELPWHRPPLSQNDRRNHMAKHREVAKVLTAARWAIRTARLGPIPTPCTVTLHWRIATRHRRDPDNLGHLAKCVLDAVVLEGLLPDDGWRYVRTTAQTIHPPNGQPAAMWLTISPLGETA